MNNEYSLFELIKNGHLPSLIMPLGSSFDKLCKVSTGAFSYQKEKRKRRKRKKMCSL